jgi:hypothetical protein
MSVFLTGVEIAPSGDLVCGSPDVSAHDRKHFLYIVHTE